MTFLEYQVAARVTATYPREHSVVYPVLGLNGEAGEVAEKVKKVIRDNDGVFDLLAKESIKKELGDVLWYIANVAADLEIPLEDIALSNIEKLHSRVARGKLKGSGDDR